MLESLLVWLTSPLVILLLGLVTVVGLILVLRLNAFLALISAAMLVSLLSPGEMSEKIARVAEAFGSAAGSIGIVIALAAIIGKCLMDSGAADRIVRSFLKWMGEKRAGAALFSAGFVLSVPVFIDTVFYLLIPLARSLWRRTHHNYVLYVTAIAGGAVLTHTLVPPTPGPLLMAENLGVDLGLMILVGLAIGIPSAVIGLVACGVMNRMLDIPMRPYTAEDEPEPLDDDQLPRLWISLMPVLLPVVLISLKTITTAYAAAETVGSGPTLAKTLADIASVIGNANLALLLSAAIAMITLVRQRGLTLKQLGATTETALMSGGVIILITSGGGAFGAMLRLAGIKDTIEAFAGTGGNSSGMLLLLIGFAVAALMKVAQGSGTVSMITTSAMVAAMGVEPSQLGFHPVYLATAIGAGSMTGSWMNDSGFWIFSRMGVMTELETLKTWSLMLTILSVTVLGLTLVAAWAVPLV